MDKQLLKAYIRTVVEDEVKRVLPQMISEIVNSGLPLSSEPTYAQTKPVKQAPVRKANFASLKETLDFSDMMTDRGDFVASTRNLKVPTPVSNTPLPEHLVERADPDVVNAMKRDYSALLKAMKVT